MRWRSRVSVETSDRIAEVFAEVLERPEPERRRFVALACRGDDAMTRRVLLLLEWQRRADEVLPPPPPPDHAWLEALDGGPEVPTGEWAGRRIGQYRIERLLAAGGMGAVFLGEQQAPRRLVALKVLRAGALSRSAAARLHHEAQVLAGLHHPGIAQVFEAGVFDDGGDAQPFFAMEYVQGVPLDEYAARRGLGVRRRLELVCTVCDAVQHAHQKGVIHRDLKPANILVDDAGRPRVLDFGVARLTDSDLQATALRTGEGELIGTIPYMSPEQVSGDTGRLDTRSDVYALGVIAYQLLARRLPHDLSGRSILEAARIVRDEPPRALGAADRSLRGDLETIVATALQNDPERRYPSAAELARDIRRYLDRQPIQARPPSTFYHLRLLARRHKTAAALTVMLFLSLGAFGAGMGLLYARSERYRSAAQENLEHASVAERKATAESQVAQEMNRSLAGLIEQSFRVEHSLTARQVADLAGAFARNAGLAEQLLGADHRLTLDSKLLLVRALGYRGQWSAARRVYAQVLDAAGRLAPDDPALRGVPSQLFLMWYALEVQGGDAEAEAMWRDAIRILRRIHGPEHPEVARALVALGKIFQRRDDQERAGQAYREALDTCRRSGACDPELEGEALHMLVRALNAQGAFEAAAALREDALRLYERAAPLPADHPLRGGAALILGELLAGQGELEEAEGLMREAADLRREALGEDHRMTAFAESVWGACLADLGRYQEAEALLLASRERICSERPGGYGPRSLYCVEATERLIDLYERLGRPDDAAPQRAFLDSGPPGAKPP